MFASSLLWFAAGVAAAAPLDLPKGRYEVRVVETIETGDLEAGRGTVEHRDPREDYTATVSGLVRVARRLKVVVDAGNATAGPVAPAIYRGMGATVMPGVTIGEYAVVREGAVVLEDVPPFAVAAGNPARVIETLPRDKVAGGAPAAAPRRP